MEVSILELIGIIIGSQAITEVAKYFLNKKKNNITNKKLEIENDALEHSTVLALLESSRQAVEKSNDRVMEYSGRISDLTIKMELNKVTMKKLELENEFLKKQLENDSDKE